MSAERIESISEFLLHAGTNFSVLDMGRGMAELPAQTFLEIENGQRMVPWPRQQHAWFAVIFWNNQPQAQEYIWFLKFPVDEQGLLVTATRNHFLQIIVDALGSSLSDDTEKAEKLPDNPYTFVPNQSVMAQFSAFTRQLFNKPQAQGVTEVEEYIRHPAVMDWTKLSVQAIADVALRLSDNALTEPLIRQMDLYAADFIQTLLHAAENTPLPDEFEQALVTTLEQGLTPDDEKRLDLARLRALASNQPAARVQRLLTQLLASEQPVDMDTLSVIAGRHFVQFDESLLKAFFEQVAMVDEKKQFNGALFQGFFADLVRLPALRDQVLALLRTPERSDSLARAIGALFSQTRGAQS